MRNILSAVETAQGQRERKREREREMEREEKDGERERDRLGQAIWARSHVDRAQHRQGGVRGEGEDEGRRA